MTFARPFRIEAEGPALEGASPLYAAGEVACRPGPGAPDRRYDAPCLGVVVDGVFDYSAPAGRGLLTKGAVVFGNEGEAFACQRLEAEGNRRAVVAFDPAVIAEVANDCALPAPGFGAAVLPASRASAGLYGAARRAAAGSLARDEALLLIGAALQLSRLRPAKPPTPAEAAKVAAAQRHMEANFEEPVTLDELARAAGLSRFHFARVFRAIVGESPHQRLIGLRLRAAADRLLDTRAPVTEIAFSVGFNDLSHFNATFRRAFGRAPGVWRRAA